MKKVYAILTAAVLFTIIAVGQTNKIPQQDSRNMPSRETTHDTIPIAPLPLPEINNPNAVPVQSLPATNPNELNKSRSVNPDANPVPIDTVRHEKIDSLPRIRKN